LGKNGLRLSHQNVANPLNKKPDSWQRSHNQIWGMTGLGPYTLPLDWPELDISLLTNDPIACLKDHFIEIFSGTSSAGGPHALHSINLIHGLISGGLPDLRRADLGWVVFDGVVYPTASPLSIRGGGSRANPYKVPLTSNSSAKAELLLWTDANSLRTALLEDYSLLPLLDVYGSDWRGDPNFMNRSMPEGPASKWSLLVEAVFRTAESCEELAEVIIDWDGDSMVRALEALDGFVNNNESISFLDIKSHNDSGKFQREADVLIPYSKGMDLIDWTVVDGISSLSGSMASIQVILVAENSERGDWASIISGIRTQLQIPMADTVNGEDFTFLVEDPVGTNLSRQIRWLDYSVIRGEQYSAGKSVADWLNSLLGHCIHDHQSLTGGSTMPQILIVAEKSACREIVATSAEIIDSGGSCEIAEIIALPTINPLSHSSSLTSDYLELVREGAHLLKRIGTLTGAQAISPRLLAVSDFVIGISQMEVV
jgi:hypothetical protein